MTNAIEQTRREMYDALAALKAGGRWLLKKGNAETFESALEEHLEALRLDRVQFTETRRDDLERRLAAMTEERDQIQQRLHAIDHAYCEQSNLVRQQAAEIDKIKLAAQTAGDCIRDTQTVNRSYQIDIKSLNQQLGARDDTIGKLRAEASRRQGVAIEYLDDMRAVERLSDELSDKLRGAQAVIGQQEQLIVGQRLAISDMHKELAHSRVIRGAFQRAQAAFSDMDAALHESAPYAAQKALGDDMIDAEFVA